MQVYELITFVQRVNENAGNLISVVQFLIYIYIEQSLNIYLYAFFSFSPCSGDIDVRDCVNQYEVHRYSIPFVVDSFI